MRSFFRLGRQRRDDCNAEDLGRSIYDLYLKRELIHVGEDIVNEAYEPDIDVKASEQLEAAEQRLYDLASTGQTERSYFEIADAATRRRRRKRPISGKPILLGHHGFRELDTMLGLHRSDLLILPAPVHVKTALATNMAFNAAKAFREIVDEHGRTTTEGDTCCSFRSKCQRNSSQVVFWQNNRRCRPTNPRGISAEEFERLPPARSSIDCRCISTTRCSFRFGLRTRARRLKSQKRLHMIVIDYLQLMQASPDRGWTTGCRKSRRSREVSRHWRRTWMCRWLRCSSAVRWSNAITSACSSPIFENPERSSRIRTL